MPKFGEPGTVIASSWGVVALASVWSDKVSELSSFLGMLFGFLGCVIPKTISAVCGFTFPMYLDPFIIGIVLSIIGLVTGTKIKKCTLADME